MPGKKIHPWTYNRQTHQPSALTSTMVGRVVEDILDKIIDIPQLYPGYITLTLKDKQALKATLRKSVREALAPTQMSFYIALAHHLLDKNNQYHLHLINSPLYTWTRQHMFGNNVIAMLFYLTKVKKDNPNV